ncbi:CHAT domain-containing protein [Nonomuraea sp. NN258]|uniref:CHAT domain-containing protein n=1 Tax=Nonomuraea antri TaxID=2730852 RepID=UPI001568A317|nr:CHAT domain-containing tetratricopeptide repeat protein [Nonomuraea antri]NRQ37854.1 CHAT domain-containing protein [Nonomuraea antri]
MSGEDPHDLLAMVFARPREALTAARSMLADGRGPYESSIARQAIGILHREFGDLDAAIGELRQAVTLARRAGSADRESDVLATLGIALLQHGRTRSGLTALDAAAERSDGTTQARVLFRRAGARWILGRHDDALDDLRRAVPALLAARDTVWAARALTLRGNVHLALGSVEPADADFSTAQRMFATTNQEHDSILAVQNRGVVAFRAGDLPAALDLLDEAERGFNGLGTPMFDLVADRCQVLLAAGLARDALEQADGGLGLLARLRGQATRRAELLLIAARAALQAADPATARARAAEARKLFAEQRRDWWAEHARLILLQAEYAALTSAPADSFPSAAALALAVNGNGFAGHGSANGNGSAGNGTRNGSRNGLPGRLLGEARRLADRLAELGSPEVWQAHLLAGRIALDLGRHAEADRHLASAGKGRHRGTATSRAGGWLAEALRAQAAGQPHRLLHACRSGLAVIEEYRLTFGSSELHALATAEGAELASLAQRHLLNTGRTRRLLAWTERWRATALAVPAVRPPDDHELLAQLASLRQLDHLLSEARSSGAASAATMERDRSRLESQVRAKTLRMRGSHDRAEPGHDGRQILAALGDGRLAEMVVIDGILHVLLCGGGRVRRHRVGPVAEAVAEVEFARSRLRRLAYERHPDQGELHALGVRLEAAVLGPVAARLGDGPIVVVPPSILHPTPWGLLPSLRRKPFTVAPSASAWLRARSAPRPDQPGRNGAGGPADGRIVLVRGPGVVNADGEVRAIAELYGGATVLADGAATAPAVLTALDGCLLAHLAAHGTFRADSPLFSSLHLDDGPLTGYDLERLHRAPYRLVLSSCDSGQMAAVGADELLGLATALLRLGTAGIVASVVPVNDETAVPVMVGLHDGLRRGLTLAEALSQARGDDVSFIAIGAG